MTMTLLRGHDGHLVGAGGGAFTRPIKHLVLVAIEGHVAQDGEDSDGATPGGRQRKPWREAGPSTPTSQEEQGCI